MNVKKIYQNLWNTSQIALRRKLIVVNAQISKEKIMLAPISRTQKKEKNKHNSSRRGEITKIRA